MASRATQSTPCRPPPPLQGPQVTPARGEDGPMRCTGSPQPDWHLLRARGNSAAPSASVPSAGPAPDPSAPSPFPLPLRAWPTPAARSRSPLRNLGLGRSGARSSNLTTLPEKPNLPKVVVAFLLQRLRGRGQQRVGHAGGAGAEDGLWRRGCPALQKALAPPPSLEPRPLITQTTPASATPPGGVRRVPACAPSPRVQSGDWGPLRASLPGS